jgi:hypothetical protein
MSAMPYPDAVPPSHPTTARQDSNISGGGNESILTSSTPNTLTNTSPNLDTNRAPIYLCDVSNTQVPRAKTTADTFKDAADKNGDGKTSRSEAKAARLSISAADLNDDGRVTRSEARLMKASKLDVKFDSIPM